MNAGVPGSIIAVVAAWLLLSALTAAIFRFMTQFVLQDSVKFQACFWAAFVGLFFQTIIFAVGLGASTAAELPEFARTLVPLVLGFFAAATANRLIMKRSDGSAISFDEACRIQLAPLALWIVVGAGLFLLNSMIVGA